MSAFRGSRDIGISVSIKDDAGPKMRKLIKKMPELTDKAVRITAARHRKRMMRWLKSDRAGFDKKHTLNPEVKARVQEKAHAFHRRKHIHRSDKAFSGKDGRAFWNALRYKKLGHGEYQFGFITPSAELFADLLARGLFMDPKTKQKDKTISTSMKRYLGYLGLGTDKETFDMPERPVIDKYLQTHRHLITRDLNNLFNSLYNASQRRLRAS